MIYDIIYSLNSSSTEQINNLIHNSRNYKYLICIQHKGNIRVKNRNIIYIDSIDEILEKYECKYILILHNTFFLRKNINLINIENKELPIKKNILLIKKIKVLKINNIEIINSNYQGILYKPEYLKKVREFIKKENIKDVNKIVINSLYNYFSNNKFIMLNKNNFYNKTIKKKKLALCFFGIHYLESLNHWTGGKKRIDYRYYVDNFKEKVIDYFNRDFDIDIFICTNKSEYLLDLLDVYKPVRHIVVENQRDQIFSKNNKVIKVLNCCMNYQEDNDIVYNNILLSRFDIFFEREFGNIDYKKLNIISTLECDHFICDNFYLFPHKYLMSFYEIFMNNRTSVAHAYKCLFEKKMDINYMCDEKKAVNLLSFYTLHKF